MDSEELIGTFRRNMKGDSGAEGPNIYRGDVSYLPSWFFRENSQKRGLSFVATNPDELWTAAELNPSHLAEQGVKSRIDKSTQNVVYFISGNQIRVGFYDRAQLEGVKQPEMTVEQFKQYKQSLAYLVDGTDSQAPRIPVMEIRPLVETFLGKNFPNMFNYRSIVFSGDRSTTYGIFVDVDRNLVGDSSEITNALLTPEFVKEHPLDMNYLFPVLLDAAKEKSLGFSDLDISHSISLEKNVLYFMEQLKGNYSATVSYKKTPQISVVARLNGIPTSISLDDGRAWEIGQGAMDIGNSYIAIISRGIFQNAKNPQDSLEGPIIYTPISREESVEHHKADENFGLLELVVMRGCKLSDVNVLFEKTSEPARFNAMEDIGSLLKGGLKGYTAGHSTISETRKAHIETYPFGFEQVILKDMLCLVHKEAADKLKAYTQ